MTSAHVNNQQAPVDVVRPAIAVSGDGDRRALDGVLEIVTLVDARNALKKWSTQGAARSLDIAKLEILDTPGALFSSLLLRRPEKK